MTPCALCGQPHEKWQAHVFATNAATNRKVATNTDATNAAGMDAEVRQIQKGDEAAQVAPGLVSRTRNRRSREAYNAYQREYMRKRRAK